MPTTDTRVPPLLADAAGCVPAPVWLRALALVLDVLLAGLVAVLILTRLVFPSEYPNAEGILQEQWQSWATQMNQAAAGHRPDVTISPKFAELSNVVSETSFFVLLAYFALSELAWGGTSLGKRVFGLRAARWGATGPPRGIESLTRCIFKTASLLWLPLFLADAIPMLFRPSRRALHDYLARTIVTGDAPPPPTETLRHDEE